jgi:hypothetical protein
MVSIGEYELKVLKALALHTESVSVEDPELNIPGGDVRAALEKLVLAEYISVQDKKYILDEQAEEYLEAIGVL